MAAPKASSQHIITFCSLKGGVGRTTIVKNLAAAMVDLGHRVLFIDGTPLDMGKDMGRPQTGIIQALLGKVRPSHIIDAPSPKRCFHMVGVGHATPNDILFYEKEALVGGLNDLLGEIAQGFDLVLCDPPAGLGAVTKAFLELSHWVIPITTCQPGAIRTLPQIASFVVWLTKKVNPRLKIGGIVLSMFNQDCRCQIHIRDHIEKKIGAYFFKTAIPLDKAFEKASFKGCLISDLPDAPQLKAKFTTLAQEIVLVALGDGATLHTSESPWHRGEKRDPLGQVLTSFCTEAGIQVAVVADEKGFPIAKHVEFSEQADLFAAFAPLMGESLQKAEWLLGIKGLGQVVIEDAENTSLYLRKINIEGAAYYLLAQAPKKLELKGTLDLLAFRVEERLRQ